MYLYNSATHKKEEFKTHTPGRVEMYTCGPTVYHFAHIGNLRSYIMEDVLEKFLRWTGYDVHRVMNITDVGHLTSDADEGEDKMLKGAKREHKTVMEIAQFYTDAFFEDCRRLNIKTPDVVQPATGCIDEYIKIVSKLMDTGYAYFAGGNVYFDTSKLGRYYVFNDHDEEDLAVGGSQQAQQERLRPLVHQEQVRGPGPEVGFPLGRRVSGVAYRVLRHLPEVQWGVSGSPLRRRGQRLPPPHQRDRSERELPGPSLVPPVVPRPSPEYLGRQDVQVQG